MSGKHRRARDGASAFTLALAAALACCALVASAAQAAPTWHIDGGKYTGEETASWSGGPIAIVNEEWGATINCNSLSGSTKTKEGQYSTGTITLSSCSVFENPYCIVEPLQMSVTGTLIGPATGQAYERYNTGGKWVIKDKGAGCALEGSYTVYGTIAAAIGTDAVKSARSFTPVAEKATGASGLQFYGDPWKVSGEATASLTGAHSGDEWGTGVGGTWTPEYGAVWMLNSEEFLGNEDVGAPGEVYDSVQIKNAAGTATVDCELFVHEGGEISGGDQSESYYSAHGCSIASAPKCEVESLWIHVTGQMAFDNYFVEKLQVDGEWFMSGTGCPFTSFQNVDGTLGAYVVPNTAYQVFKMFEPEPEEVTKATGLHVGNEYWHVTTEAESVPIGPNQGHEFGVELVF